MMETVSELFDAVEAYIARQEFLLEQGMEEEMGELSALSSRLAESVLALPHEAGAAQAARMEKIMAALSGLAGRIKARRRDTAAELQRLSLVVKRANAAYRTAGRKEE